MFPPAPDRPPSGRDCCLPAVPGVETPGYWPSALRAGRIASLLPLIRIVPDVCAQWIARSAATGHIGQDERVRLRLPLPRARVSGMNRIIAPPGRLDARNVH